MDLIEIFNIVFPIDACKCVTNCDDDQPHAHGWLYRFQWNFIKILFFLVLLPFKILCLAAQFIYTKCTHTQFPNKKKTNATSVWFPTAARRQHNNKMPLDAISFFFSLVAAFYACV